MVHAMVVRKYTVGVSFLVGGGGEVSQQALGRKWHRSSDLKGRSHPFNPFCRKGN